MLGIYFSVLDPDRHPSVLALLTIASALGTAAGAGVCRRYAAIERLAGSRDELLILMVGVVIASFFLGFTKAGKLWIPVLFLFFSALGSSSVFLFIKELPVSPVWRMLGKALGACMVFISAFLMSAQTIIYSGRFSSSRRTSRTGAHRTSYFLSFLILTISCAAGTAALIYL